MAELTSLTLVKRYLSISVSTYDTELTACIDAAEESLRRICNRPDGWLTSEWTETFDGEASGRLVLTNVPVNMASDVTITIDDATLDADAYTVQSRTGIVRMKRGSYTTAWDGGSNFPLVATFGTGLDSVDVTYTGGYAADAMPAGLIRIATEMAAEMYRAETRDGNVKSEQMGRYSVTYADVSKGDGFFDRWKERVGPYIRHDR